MKSKYLILLLIFSACQLVFADYLVTNRKTSVKEGPGSTFAPILQVEEGTALQLLDEGQQTNGYYKVLGENFSGVGYIYKTFVRRYTGQAPWMISRSTHGQVDVRVVDVGPGLCTLIKLPDGKYIIYDTGHKQWMGQMPLSQISAVIPVGSEIELMVLSHNHADHMGGAEHVIKNYQVKKVLWSGYSEPPVAEQSAGSMNQRFLKAIREASNPITTINLFERDSTITPGTKLSFGEVDLLFLCGFGKPQDAWLNDIAGSGMKGERINSVSIVMKLQYKGNSILFCGDAVGRHRGGDEDELIATEAFLVQYAKPFLKSTILISPHHGADNGNSNAFIDQVKPERVIFSAGHDYNHPTQAAANRYLKYLLPDHLLRTDRGDDEREIGKPDYEWSYGRVDGCTDELGDDDIHIELRSDGSYLVYYINPVDPCSTEIED